MFNIKIVALTLLYKKPSIQFFRISNYFQVTHTFSRKSLYSTQGGDKKADSVLILKPKKPFYISSININNTNNIVDQFIIFSYTRETYLRYTCIQCFVKHKLEPKKRKAN